MATFKHINSKNARYSDAEKYLLFEHDEFTMKPILDDNGRLIPREDYRIAALNCDGQDFAIACMRANLQYGKNLDRGDVKSHHIVVASSTSLASPHAAKLVRSAAPPLPSANAPLVCAGDPIYATSTVHQHCAFNIWYLILNRKGRRLAGVAFSCVSRVSPVVPSACGRYEIHHLKRLPKSIVQLLYRIYSRL